MSLVLDASVALAWCLPDESTGEAEAVVQRLDVGSAFVPPIFRCEVANGLVLAQRSGRLTDGAAASAVTVVDRLPITVTDAGQDSRALLHVAKLYRLTAYDAAYLALASAEGLPLATFDAALRRAAKKAGVALV